jgi:hypothetical protein
VAGADEKGDELAADGPGRPGNEDSHGATGSAVMMTLPRTRTSDDPYRFLAGTLMGQEQLPNWCSAVNRYGDADVGFGDLGRDLVLEVAPFPTSS